MPFQIKGQVIYVKDLKFLKSNSNFIQNLILDTILVCLVTCFISSYQWKK